MKIYVDKVIEDLGFDGALDYFLQIKPDGLAVKYMLIKKKKMRLDKIDKLINE